MMTIDVSKPAAPPKRAAIISNKSQDRTKRTSSKDERVDFIARNKERIKLISARSKTRKKDGTSN